MTKNVLCAGCQLHLTQWLRCVRWQPPQIKWLTSLHANSWWRRPRSEGPAWSSCLRALTTSDPVERRHCRSLRAWQETQYHNTHSWPGRQSVILFCFFARSKVQSRQLLLRDDFLYSNILRIHSPAGVLTSCGSRTLEVWLSLGGFHERGPDWVSDRRIYNSHVIINEKGTFHWRVSCTHKNMLERLTAQFPLDDWCTHTNLAVIFTGDIVSVYRKSHLFDVELPEKGVSLKESAFTIPGPTLVSPVQTPIGKVCFYSPSRPIT